MKQLLALLVMTACGLSLGGLAAGEKDKDKVHTVGKQGLTIESKIAENDKSYDYKLNFDGMDVELKLRAKRYLVKLDAGAKYTMTMDTKDMEFDPLLVVQDNAGKILAFDDDSGGKLNAKLEFSPAKSGTFTINAAALRDTLGPYTLKIVAAAGGK